MTNFDRDTDIFSGPDIRASLWQEVLAILEDPTGKRVLEIGCDAEYISVWTEEYGGIVRPRD